MKTKIAIATFGIIGLFLSGCGRGYVVDKRSNTVIWETWDEGHGTWSRVVSNANSATFEEIKAGDLVELARDRNSVYYKGKLVHGADPSSFQKLDLPKASGEYYRDAMHVFQFSGYDDHVYILAESDPESFEVINRDWSRDAKRVYLYDSGFEPHDIDSFEPLVRIWSRDNQAYYFGTREVSEADRENFRISEEMPRFAFDQNHVYWHGWLIEGCNPRTFRITNSKSGSDDRFTYHFELIWDGSDASFQRIKVHKKSLK